MKTNQIFPCSNIYINLHNTAHLISKTWQYVTIINICILFYSCKGQYITENKSHKIGKIINN